MTEHTVSPSVSSSHRNSFEPLQPQMARAALRASDWRSLCGAALSAAIRSVGWSYKEAAAALDMDQAQLSRWIHGTETLQLHRVMAVEDLRAPFVLAQARLDPERCEVITTISMRRTA